LSWYLWTDDIKVAKSYHLPVEGESQRKRYCDGKVQVAPVPDIVHNEHEGNVAKSPEKLYAVHGEVPLFSGEDFCNQGNSSSDATLRKNREVHD
jgi:hypothetical protein